MDAATAAYVTSLGSSGARNGTYAGWSGRSPDGREYRPLAEVLSSIVTPLPAKRPGRLTQLVTATERGAGWIEIGLIAVWYLGYSALRVLFEPASPGAATGRALDIERLERHLHVYLEPAANRWLNGNFALQLSASYWYAAAYYLVTPAVLIWLFHHRRAVYARARTTVILVTLASLAINAGLPTTPPRLMPGFHDILAQTASHGWWPPASSTPQGLGKAKNELAAFPSMHAGWSLWVALALADARVPRPWRLLGIAYSLTTVAVIVTTANHWLADAVAGMALMSVGYWLLARLVTSVSARSQPRSDIPLGRRFRAGSGDGPVHVDHGVGGGVPGR